MKTEPFAASSIAERGKAHLSFVTATKSSPLWGSARVFLRIGFAVIFIAASWDLRANPSSPSTVNGKDSYKLVNGTTDADGFSTTPAKLCIGAEEPQRCYTPPAHNPPFGANAKAQEVKLGSGTSLVLFAAESTAGGSGSLVTLALLEDHNARVRNLLPELTLSELGEYDAWMVSNSAMPIVVTADFVWAEGEAHFGPHRYRITTYIYDGKAARYSQQDQYITTNEYEKNVLQQESSTILARLKNSLSSPDSTSATGDSLSKTLHPPAQPLPGLPDLKKPIFLSSGAVVCEGPDRVYGMQREVNRGLRNSPYGAMILQRSHCTVSDHDVNVLVLTPTTTDPQVLLVEKAYQTVAIEWVNSDGSTDTAWTLVTSLRN